MENAGERGCHGWPSGIDLTDSPETSRKDFCLNEADGRGSTEVRRKGKERTMARRRGSAEREGGRNEEMCTKEIKVFHAMAGG